MKGKVHSFDVSSDIGLITSEDADRYEFYLDDWRSAGAPLSGTFVDFFVDERAVAREVRQIELEPRKKMAEAEAVAEEVAAAQMDVSEPARVGKSRFVAAALAFFFGGLGVQKFYIGAYVPGAIMLAVSLVGTLLVFIPTIAIGIIALAESVIYLITPSEKFHRVYIHGQRAWF